MPLLTHDHQGHLRGVHSRGLLHFTLVGSTVGRGQRRDRHGGVPHGGVRSSKSEPFPKSAVPMDVCGAAGEGQELVEDTRKIAQQHLLNIVCVSPSPPVFSGVTLISRTETHPPNEC